MDEDDTLPGRPRRTLLAPHTLFLAAMPLCAFAALVWHIELNGPLVVTVTTRTVIQGVSWIMPVAFMVGAPVASRVGGGRPPRLVGYAILTPRDGTPAWWTFAVTNHGEQHGIIRSLTWTVERDGAVNTYATLDDLVAGLGGGAVAADYDVYVTAGEVVPLVHVPLDVAAQITSLSAHIGYRSLIGDRFRLDTTARPAARVNETAVAA